MKIGPKFKIAKRLGAGIFEKTQTAKFTRSEERHKNARRGKKPRAMSDYGKQFLEKQKLRFAYGITEKQLQKYISETVNEKDSPAAIFAALELRADNAVYRLGLAKTRRMARQLVSHGHIVINGVRSTIPSHALKVGDVLTLREGSKDSALFVNISELNAPAWMTPDVAKKSGKIVSTPVFKQDETMFNLAQIFEFYTR
ncbi:MAG: 30S ribosomal protein S4 [Minisyncoccia bacterium]